MFKKCILIFSFFLLTGWYSSAYLTVKVFNFSGTKQAAHRLKIIFGLSGMKAAELHGNLTQAQRLDVSNLLCDL